MPKRANANKTFEKITSILSAAAGLSKSETPQIKTIGTNKGGGKYFEFKKHPAHPSHTLKIELHKTGELLHFVLTSTKSKTSATIAFNPSEDFKHAFKFQFNNGWRKITPQMEEEDFKTALGGHEKAISKLYAQREKPSYKARPL